MQDPPATHAVPKSSSTQQYLFTSVHSLLCDSSYKEGQKMGGLGNNSGLSPISTWPSAKLQFRGQWANDAANAKSLDAGTLKLFARMCNAAKQDKCRDVSNGYNEGICRIPGAK